MERDSLADNNVTLLAVDHRAESMAALREIIAAHMPSVKLLDAASAGEGLDVAGRFPPDVVLVNPQLPADGAVALCRGLKAGAATANIPVLILAEHDTPATLRAEVLDAGADDVVRLPVEDAELVGRIHVMLRIKNAEDQWRRVSARAEELIEERTETVLESMQRSVDFMHAIPLGLFTFRYEPLDSLILIDGNVAAERLTHVRIREHCGKDIREVWPNLPEEFREAFLNAMETGQAFTHEHYEYKTLTVDAVFQIHAFRMGNDLAVLLDDITNLKRSEEALHANTTLLNTLLDTIPDPVFHVDTDGVYRCCNAAFAQSVLGLSKDQVIGRSPAQLNGALPDALAHAHRGADGPKRGVRLYEAKVRRADGYEGEFMCNESALRDASGRPRGIVGVMVDVTHRKQAQQQRAKLEEHSRRARRMESVGCLAGGVAHDLRNQLTVIRGYCDLLLPTAPHDHDTRKGLEEIHSAAARAARITDHLLSFSRRQSHRAELLDLDETLSMMLSALTVMAGEDVHVHLTPAASPSTVLADPGQVEQAVINLVLNASDAMPDGGELTIDIVNVDLDEPFVRDHPGTAPGPHVMLRVCDTGVGMSEEIRDRAFDPFFTTKAPGQGTGLGLSMVYGFARQSSGVVTVESAVGQGAAFSIYLPQVDEGAVAVGEDPVRIELPRGQETVLVVSQEPPVRQLVTHVLRECGYTVIQATNPRDALPLGLHYHGDISLLVTDTPMDPATGGRLADRLQQDHPGMQALFVPPRATDEAPDRIDIEAQGNVLPRPFDPAGLAKTVRNLLDATDTVVATT